MEVTNDDTLIVSLGHYITPDEKNVQVLTAGRMDHQTTQIRVVNHLEGDAAQAMYDLLIGKEGKHE